MQDNDPSGDENPVPVSKSHHTEGSGIKAIKTWLVGKLSDSLNRRITNIAQSEDVVRIAVMPDIHEGSSVPNGCVIATRSLIYPEAVGKDIGCGISAIQFSISADIITTSSLATILQDLTFLVPSLKFPLTEAVSALPDACAARTLSNDRLQRLSFREGRIQLGTLGRGNHFVELQRDDQGMLWAMVHTGSRFMGEAITAFHLTKSIRCSHSNLAYLDFNKDAGQSYLNDMQWAMMYATENRLLILNRLADLLEREFHAEVHPNTYIDCPHNFARMEEHFGEQLIVHRKSANSAIAEELGIIPASMAAGCRIVRGLGECESLQSSSHGAGRVMSRREAAKKIPSHSFLGTMQGIVFQQEKWKSLRDEAPAAYKNINNVMRAQKDLVRTVQSLSTILNYKGVGS